MSEISEIDLAQSSNAIDVMIHEQRRLREIEQEANVYLIENEKKQTKEEHRSMCRFAA